MSDRRIDELLFERGRALAEERWLDEDAERDLLDEIRADARREALEPARRRRAFAVVGGLLAAAASVMLVFGTRFRPGADLGRDGELGGAVALYDSGGRPLETAVRGGARIERDVEEVLVELRADAGAWATLVLYAVSQSDPGGDSAGGEAVAKRVLVSTIEPPPSHAGPDHAGPGDDGPGDDGPGGARLLGLPLDASVGGGVRVDFVLVVAWTPGRLPPRVVDGRFPLELPAASAAELVQRLERDAERLGAARTRVLVEVLSSE